MRILTWNLWWRFGDWRLRQEANTSVLLREQPDVVGLQEVWTEEGHDQAEQLAFGLGMERALARAPDAGRWQSRAKPVTAGVGNAVLSRWPITAVEVMHLPAAPGHGVERTLLLMTIGAPSGPFVFATTHLHSDVEGGALRLEQAEAIATRLALVPATCTVVLTGDFNAGPASPEVRRLLAPAEGGAAGLHLIDAWTQAGGRGPGWTWDVRNPHAAAYGPDVDRVDYVLVRPPAGTTAMQIRARLSGDEPVAGTWPSDHCAVVVDLAI